MNSDIGHIILKRKQQSERPIVVSQSRRQPSSWFGGIQKFTRMLLDHCIRIFDNLMRFARVSNARRLIVFGTPAVFICLIVVLPILSTYFNAEHYDLTTKTVRLLGPVNSNLVSKIDYDKKDSSYYFNQSAIADAASPASSMHIQIGGDGKNDPTLYSAQLPTDPSKGITYYDDNLDLSFNLIPQASFMSAQEEQGRLVYAAADGIQDVYTVKNNGVKDDIVLTKPVGNDLAYTYKLNLPDTLQARIIPGTDEVGIYSASSVLYNNINFGDNADREKVMNARVTAVKTNLVFVMPSPVIKTYSSASQGSTTSTSASAHFALSQDGTLLTVEADGLQDLSYPLSIDPSVVTTTTSNFETGNNDGDIDYTTSNQITRGAITGGAINSSGWVSNGSGEAASSGGSPTVAYNNFLYQCVGNTIYYAQISSGAVGSWTASTSYNNSLVTCAEGNFIEYNGYLYIINGSGSSSVQYAPLNTTTGVVGSWSTTSSTTTIHGATSASVAYNGYLYVIGGYTGSAVTNVTEYAPLGANGTLGTWTSSTVYPLSEQNLSAVVDNGYIYAMGGINSSLTASSAVYEAPLSSTTGAIGTWVSTSAFTTARSGFAAQVMDGYVYIYGGCSLQSSTTNCTTGDVLQDTQYAPLNENGTLGTWQTTTTITSARWQLSSAVYAGYLYIVGGCSGGSGTCGTTAHTDIHYAQASSAGAAATTSWNTATPSTTNAESGSCTVAYEGYLYDFGGHGASYYTTSLYSAITSSTGNIGSTWTSGTALPSVRTQVGCAAANGYVYIVGGNNSTSDFTDVEYAAVNPTSGALGSWTAETGTSLLPTATTALGVTAYDGYLYAVGGNNGSVSSTVYYAALNASTGAVGAWTTATNSLGTATEYPNVMVNDGYLYAVGGDSGSTSSGINAVQYSLLSTSTGAPGAWSSSTYSFTTRTQQSAAIWDGILYIYGGYDGTNYYNDVNYAPLSSSGVPGAWTTTTTFTTARYGAASTAYDGVLYEVAGDASAGFKADTQYVALNNGGQGIGTWTTATNSLASTIGSNNGITANSFVGYEGFLYSVGGNPGVNGSGAGGSGAVSAVYYAPVNSDGSPGTWTQTSSMVRTRAAETTIAYNGYLYAIGGYGTGTTDNVEYALICTGSNNGTGGCGSTAGTLGTWTLGTSFTDTQMTSGVGAVEWNGYLYALGGTNSSYSATVDYAPINANGSVGTWTATTSLPSARSISGDIAVYNGYVYVLGGTNGSGQASLGDLAMAQINPTTHALGSFTDLSNALPWQLSSGGIAAALNGYLYYYEGFDVQYGSGLSRKNTFYAAIEPNGLIGPWQQSTSLNIAHINGAGTVYNGVLYAAGGYSSGSSGTYYADVQFAPLTSTPRTGEYSTLLNLGSATYIVDGISYTGTVPNNQLDINYETAGSSGVLSSAASAYTLGTQNCLTGTYTVNEQYVWLSVILDDSTSGIYPDSDSNTANATNLTVNYSSVVHPPPANRLRTGQSLQSGVLTPLDTCYP